MSYKNKHKAKNILLSHIFLCHTNKNIRNKNFKVNFLMNNTVLVLVNYKIFLKNFLKILIFAENIFIIFKIYKMNFDDRRPKGDFNSDLIASIFTSMEFYRSFLYYIIYWKNIECKATQL